jgi:hypothetical protein
MAHVTFHRFKEIRNKIGPPLELNIYAASALLNQVLISYQSVEQDHQAHQNEGDKAQNNIGDHQRYASRKINSATEHSPFGGNSPEILRMLNYRWFKRRVTTI